MTTPQPLHAVAWLVWALAAAASLELAPSPLYVALVVAVAAVVVSVHGQDTPVARTSFSVLLVFGVLFALLRIVLTTLTTHAGSDVLFTLPHVDLPRVLGGFQLGGTVELPVLLQASAEAFVVVGVMAVFGAFNAVVSHHELVQSAPRAFYEAGLVVTVAVAFVPSTIATVHRVGEADLARTGGRVVRRGRLLRRALPVLESGLERSLALAESMDARGFGHVGSTGADRLSGALSLVALLGLAGAFVALVGRAGEVAVAMGAAGAVSLAAAVAVASRQSRRVRYRPRRMKGDDWAVAGVCLLAPAGLALMALAGDDSLVWSASPLRLPALNVSAVLALAALVAPAVCRPERSSPGADESTHAPMTSAAAPKTAAARSAS
ncbi:MAG TPA: hypothetical protein VM142_12895 [Acidimicrobiales bacterium]|nr:hypothetical protein [Acidimicrobiales bacterium]